MTDARTDAVAALAEQQDELEAILDPVAGADWHRPSPCDGWDVADVVLHLAQTNEMAIGSLQGRFAEAIARLTAGVGTADNVDDGAALMVSHDRGQGPEAIHQRWQASTAGLRAAIDDADLSSRVRWVAGELSARTLVTTRLAETWIHTGDVAEALAIELDPTDRLWHVARLAWRTLPYAFAQDDRRLSGPVAFDLHGPSGDRWTFTDGEATTTVTGEAVDLCRVAARRVDPAETSLIATGPDGSDVLRLVRTYA